MDVRVKQNSWVNLIGLATLAAALIPGQAMAQTVPGPMATVRAQPTAPADRALRVAAVARRILLANGPVCDRHRSDFGLIAGPATLNSWGAPVQRVWADGPAFAAGLRPGDLIREVNAVPWSADATERARFAAALAAAPEASRLALVIERGDARFAVSLTGQQRCHVDVELSGQAYVNAAAMASTITIGSGLERVLRDDAELAWAIAHEMAHVILGHTAPDRRAAISQRAERLALEQAADAFAIRLMAAAGYAPSAAPAAWLKVADASRQPLARMMDLHGPYLGTLERTAFLAAEASRIHSPGAANLLAARR